MDKIAIRRCDQNRTKKDNMLYDVKPTSAAQVQSRCISTFMKNTGKPHNPGH